jgi:hypothetical protein
MMGLVNMDLSGLPFVAFDLFVQFPYSPTQSLADIKCYLWVFADDLSEFPYIARGPLQSSPQWRQLPPWGHDGENPFGLAGAKEVISHIDHVNDGEILDTVTLEEGRLCRVVKEDICDMDKEEKKGGPEEKGDLILVNVQPFSQESRHPGCFSQPSFWENLVK